MSHTESDAAGLGRRELLQRAAWVSGAGAVAWVAPSVTTFGARAAAGTNGEIIGDPDGDTNISHIAFIFVYDGTRYAAKAEFSGGAWRWTENGFTKCTELSDGTPVEDPDQKEQWAGRRDPDWALDYLGDVDGGLDLLASIDIQNVVDEDDRNTGDVVFTCPDHEGLTFAAYAIFQANSCSTDGGSISLEGRVFTAVGWFEPDEPDVTVEEEAHGEVEDNGDGDSVDGDSVDSDSVDGDGTAEGGTNGDDEEGNGDDTAEGGTNGDDEEGNGGDTAEGGTNGAGDGDDVNGDDTTS